MLIFQLEPVTSSIPASEGNGIQSVPNSSTHGNTPQLLLLLISICPSSRFLFAERVSKIYLIFEDMHIKYLFVIKSLQSCVKTLETGCKHLLPFHPRSSNEAGHWYRVIRPSSRLTFHFIPKVVDGFENQGSVQEEQPFAHTHRSTAAVSVKIKWECFVYREALKFKQERL